MNKYNVLIIDVTGSRPTFYTNDSFETLEECYQYLDKLKGEDIGNYVFHAEISKIIDNEYRLMIEHPYT